MNISGRFTHIQKKYLGWLKRWPMLVSVVVFVGGIIFWGGFNTAMEMTNSEAFCISCHEMEENVFREYKQTVHYSNRTGVRATCPDCHVPREWTHMFMRKVGATNELFHKLAGSISSPEKFKAKRLTLAGYVWADMRASDSRECRNCHAFQFMALDKQHEASNIKHARAQKENMTCIDCHMGIAHKLPADYDADGKIHDSFKRSKRPCSDCHKNMAQSFDW